MQKRLTDYSYLIIAIGVLAAHAPVLIGSYLRQDDLVDWYMKPNATLKQHPLFYNTIFEVVRPISLLIIDFTDKVSEIYAHAVYLRFLNILLIMAIAVGVYLWLRCYLYSSVFSATFSVVMVTLPGYQVLSATANYMVILIANIFAVLASHAYRRGEESAARSIRWTWYAAGAAIFFASLLDYPLGSMMVWLLVAISLANASGWAGSYRRAAISLAPLCVMASLMMLLYFGLTQLVHILFHVEPALMYANITHDPSFMLKKFLIAFFSHFDLWFFDDYEIPTYHPWHTAAVGAVLLLSALLAWLRLGKNNLISIYLFLPAWVLGFAAFFAAADFPVIVGPFDAGTFRYTPDTMPLWLFLMMVLTADIFGVIVRPLLRADRAMQCQIAAAALFMLFAIAYCSTNLWRYIVQPHVRAFAGMTRALREESVFDMRAKGMPVNIIVVWDDKFVSPRQVEWFEYRMDVAQYLQTALGAVVFILRANGFDLDFSNPRETDYSRVSEGIVTAHSDVAVITAVAAPALQQYLDQTTSTYELVDPRKY